MEKNYQGRKKWETKPLASLAIIPIAAV